MRMIDIIEKKRNKEVLTNEEIKFVIKGYTDGSIPDYQMSALVMAIFLNGMNKDETVSLTHEMAHSGDMLDLSQINGNKVDKHSTGGVGDKTTLVVAPLAAACGVPIAKMSGRALGFSGGTVDKLESFEGIDLRPTQENFIKQVNEYGIAVIAQTGDLAPADKKIYALRDATSTVENKSLIASSIMSKKIASGCDKIVLDVKVGSGAFMKTPEDAKELAKIMVDIGNDLNRNTIGVITNMDEPLGVNIGNILEIKEAIEVLNGNGPEDFKELSIVIATYMVMLGKDMDSYDDARRMVIEKIDSREGLQKLKDLVRLEGGDESLIDNPDNFKEASIIEEIVSDKSGYVKAIYTNEIGKASMILGAGRETKEDPIDYTAGLKIYKKNGDYINEGEVIGHIYTNKPEKVLEAKEMIINAYELADYETPKATLIYDVVR